MRGRHGGGGQHDHGRRSEVVRQQDERREDDKRGHRRAALVRVTPFTSPPPYTHSHTELYNVSPVCSRSLFVLGQENFEFTGRVTADKWQRSAKRGLFLQRLFQVLLKEGSEPVKHRKLFQESLSTCRGRGEMGIHTVQ